MTNATLARRAAVALSAFTLACGDSTGPKPDLTQEQVMDMLEAMAVVASPEAAAGSNLATITVSQTVSCPRGGTASVNGSVTADELAGTASAQVTHGFSACMTPSKKGRVWTLDGDPNVVTSFSASHNQTSGVFNITASQVGGIKFASELGSGACQIDLHYTLSGNANSVTSTLSGSACGHTIEQTVTVTQ
jgi:hypothetical protein